MAFLAPNDILVLEKATGQVRRVLGGVLQPGNVLDVHVNFASERGLLGIAINTESPPQVFLYYTEATRRWTAARRSATASIATPGTPALGMLQSPQLILDLPVTRGPNHDGGVLLLGPPGVGSVGDGSLLYVVIGDLNRNGQLQNNAGGAAPDDTSVILRVEQDGTAAPGNPFVPYCSVTTTQTCPGGGGCPGGETCLTQVARYFAYGVRNSFGLALDPVTGDLWDTENGPGNYDEVNRVAPGFNSGWNRIMGPDARDPQGVGDLFNMPGAGITYSDPEFSWFDTNAPTAIVFPNGSTLGAAYDDVALVGDTNNGNLYRFPLNGARTGFDFSAFPDLQTWSPTTSTEQNQLRIGQGFGAHHRSRDRSGRQPVRRLDLRRHLPHLGARRVHRRRRRRRRPTPRRRRRPPRSRRPRRHADGDADRAVHRRRPTCAATPEVCRTPVVGGKALIVLKDKADDAKDFLLWKWLKGAATDEAEFGDPVTTHTYELCIYDGTGLVAGATAPADTVRRQPVLEADRQRLQVSRPGSARPDGLQTIVLKAGATRRPRSSCAARASTSTCRISSS